MARLRVEIVPAQPGRDPILTVELERGATIRDALRAAGLPLDQPVGVYGRRVALDDRLGDGDRIELYRPLRVAPGVARRRRALSRTIR